MSLDKMTKSRSSKLLLSAVLLLMIIAVLPTVFQDVSAPQIQPAPAPESQPSAATSPTVLNIVPSLTQPLGSGKQGYSIGPMTTSTVTLTLTGPGSGSGFTFSGCSAAWSCLTSNDADTSYVTQNNGADASGDFAHSSMPAYTSISNVAVYWTSKKVSGCSDPYCRDRAYLYISGTDYYSAYQTLTTSYVVYSASWATNPAGGAWTYSTINAMYIGLHHNTNGLLRSTYMYAVVTYTVPTYALSVSSAYDSPTGAGTYDSGTLVGSSVTTPVSCGSGCQYVTTGWTGTGSIPSGGTVGSSTTGSYAITQTSSVTWNWKTQYYLTVTGGSSPTGQGWYDSGTNAQASNAWIWGTSGSTRTALTNWQLDGSNQNPTRSNTGTFTTPNIGMSAAHTANFVSTTQYYLTVTGGNGVTYGTASPTADGWYDSGGSTTVSSNGVYSRGSGTGQRVASWKVDSGTATNVATAGTVTTSSVSMTTYHTVTFTSLTQYQVTLDSGAASALNSVTSPTISGDNYWYDSSTPVTLTINGVYGRSAGAGTRITGYKINGGSSNPVSTTGTVTVLNALSISALQAITTTAVTQYQVTFDSGATSALSSCTGPTITSDNYWYDSGASGVSCTFNGVYGRGSGTGSRVSSYKWDSGSSTGETTAGTFTTTAVTMSATHQVNAVTVTQYQLTLNAAATSALSSCTTPTISGDNYWYDSGTASVTCALNGVYGRASTTGTRVASYNWDSGSNTNEATTGTFTTASQTMSATHQVNANTVTQFFLTVAGASGVTYGTATPISGDAGWYDSTQSTTVSSSGVYSRAAGTGQRVASWKIDGGSNTAVATTGSVMTSSVTMSAAHTVTFNSVTQYQVTLDAGATSSLNSIASPTISSDNYWYDSGTAVTLILNGVYGRVSGTGSRLTGYQVNGGGNNPVSTTGTVTVLDALSISVAQSITTTTTTQYQVSFASSGIGGDTSGTVVSVNGTAVTQSQLASGYSVWYDSGTHSSYTLSSPVAASAGKQYTWASTSGLSQTLQSNVFTVSGTGTVTGTYTTQYQIIYSTSGIGVDTGSATVLTVNGTNYQQSQMSVSIWYNSGQKSNFTFQSPISGSASNRYSWSSTSGLSTLQSATITVSAGGSVTGVYATQYQLTINLNGHGVSNVTSGSWYNSGVAVGVKISSDSTNSSSAQYLYNGATGTGTASYTGSGRAFQVTVSTAITESVAWQAQYYLTMTAGTGGSVLPVSGWQNSGANVTITATPAANYGFASWSGAGAGAYSGTVNPHWVVVSSALNETASFDLLTVSITVASNPAGSGYVYVDGSAVTTPQAFSWIIDSSHNITAVPVVSCISGCQYIFQAWNDTGARSHSITVPSSSTTYTATFQQQYQVTFTASGASGAGSNTVVTVQSVNYTVGQLPYTAWYSSGASIAYAFASPIGGAAGTRYAWVGTDGLGQSLQSSSFLVSGTGTVTGTYKTQYQLTTSVSPVSSGTVSLNPTGGWYDSGAVVNATASASGGYAFSGWVLDGIGAGRASPFQLTMSGTHDLVANFLTQVTMTVSYQVVGGGSPTAPYFNYTHGGVAVQYTLTTAGTPISVDQGSSWLVAPNPLTGSSSSERWHSGQSLSGTASAGPSIFTFYHQYLQTLSFSIAGGGSGYSAASFTANRLGSSTPQTLTTTPTGYWFDSGASWTIGNPLGGSTGSERWVTSATASGTVTSSQTLSFSYQHQFYLTLTMSPNNGTLIPSSGWENYGATVQIIAVPSSDYSFSLWSGTGSGSYSGQDNPASVTMNGPIAEAAMVELTPVAHVTVTSTPTGTGKVTVDGQAITTPTTYSWDIGDNHTIAASSSSGELVFVNWSDSGSQSHVITVSNSTTTYTASFGAHITVTSNPAGSGYVAVDGSAVTTPQAYTWVYGSAHNLTAYSQVSCGANCQYVYSHWSDSGARSHTISTPSFTATYTATFSTQAIMTVSYQVVGGGSPTAPSFHYVQNNTAQSMTLTGTPTAISADSSTAWSVIPNPLTGSGGSERWYSNQTLSGTVAAGTYLFAFYHQYLQTLSYSVAGGGTPTAPAFTARQFGELKAQSLALFATGYWFDAGTAWTATNPISGASGERWNTTQTVSGTVAVAQTLTFSYQHQYYLTITKGTNPTHGIVITNSGWKNANATVQIVALGIPGHSFASWVSTDPGGYSGTNDPANVVMYGPVSELANFNSYPVSVTIISDPAGTGYVKVDNATLDTPITLVWGVGEIHNVSANSPANGYAFVRWSDGGAQSHSITLPAGNSTYTAYFGVNEQITVTSNPAGSGYVGVDGTAVTAPQTYTWLSNSLHNVTATETVSGGTGVQYVFQSWSDSGTETHTVTVPGATTTYTANYQTQYYLTVQSGVGGTASPSSSWKNASDQVQIHATANDGYAFDSWTGSGAGSYTGAENPHTITITGPMTETASFDQVTQVTVNSIPAGSGYMTVDNTPITTPQAFTWTVSSNHTITATPTVSCGAGCQYTFASWNDTGTRSHTITTPASPITVTASFQQQYYLTTAAGSGGNVSPSSRWENAGANVTITATPDANYTFASWAGVGTGSYSGAANPHWVVMNNAINETATFNLSTVSITVTSNPVGSGYVYVDGNAITTQQAYSWIIGSSHNITAVSVVNCGTGCQYVFQTWSDDGLRSHSYTVSSSATVTATFQQQYQLTINLNGHGASNVTSDNFYASGTIVKIGVSGDASNSSSTRYLYNGVTGTGTGSYTGSERMFQVTMSTAVAEGIAWQTQQYLTVTAGTGGTASPSSGWHDAGVVVQIQASPATDYGFSSWTGSGTGSYTGTDNPANVTMSGAITEAASFASTTVEVTVASSPAGSGYVTVDGFGITAPHNFTWTIGTSHTIAASSPVACGTGCQYVYEGWSDSGAQTHNITASTATTITAAFTQQFYLTMQAGAGGDVSPASGWRNSGANVMITATPHTDYAFASWTGAGAGSYSGASNPHWVVISNEVNETATFNLSTVSITVTSNPTGSEYVYVDGSAVTAPQTYSWVIGSSHNITAVSVASCGAGCRYVFQSWSDSGSRSHSYTIPSSPATVTATFQQQYYLTTAAGTGGTVSPGSGWEAAGANVTITATPYSGYAFASWNGTGAGSYSGALNPHSVVAGAAITEAASFSQSTVSITVTSDPTGSGFLQVDGQPISTPQTFSWVVGSRHEVTASPNVAGPPGVCFTNGLYEDRAGVNGTEVIHADNVTYIVPDRADTLTAYYTTLYYLTVNAGAGGTATPSSGWHNAGSSVQISATANGGYAFAAWTGSGSGSYTGTANPTNVTVTAPITETAAFTQVASAQVQSSTGLGTITLNADAGSVSGLQAVPEASLPAEGKPDLQFTYGFIRFHITNLTPGATVGMSITLPGAIPAGAQYWKYQTGVGWTNMTQHTSYSGNTVTLTLTDGGAGDQDGVANGVIVDDGGVGLPPGTIPVTGGNNGNGTVIVTGLPPSILSIQIDPGDGSNASSINVDTYYSVKVTVSDNNTLADLQRLELRLYQNSTTWGSSPTLDQERRQGAAWTYTLAWQQLGSGGWTSPDGVYFDSAHSQYPTLTATSGTFIFKLKVWSVSHYTAANGWNVQAWAETKSDVQKTRTNNLSVNLYVSLTVPTSIAWTASAGSSNAQADNMPFIVQYTSNAVAKLRLNATDPTSQYGDAFASSNLRISDTTNPNGPHSQQLSNTLADWRTGLDVADGASLNAYWFVSVPAGQPTGTYQFTYNVSMVFQDYAT